MRDNSLPKDDDDASPESSATTENNPVRSAFFSTCFLADRVLTCYGYFNQRTAHGDLDSCEPTHE